MTLTRKRRRGDISYKEPSSDEDFSSDPDHARSAKKRHATPSRRSARHIPAQDYHDESETDAVPQSTSPKTRRAPRSAQRPNRRQIHYKDISSDDEGEEDPDADFEVVAQIATTPRTSRTKATGNSKPRRETRLRRYQKLGGSRKPNLNPESARVTLNIPSDGNTPAWHTLPYHVLLQIFVYASHPLHDENMRPTPSIPWLVKMARVCTTFKKPALTALYRTPPIFAMRQTRRDLVHHLIAHPAESPLDYKVMVKRLEVDVTQFSSLTDSAHSVADLAALVKALTTLRELDIFDPIDRPPFRDRLRRLRRWVYPDELFAALRDTQLRLRSWRWNSTFSQHGPLHIKSIHGEPAFQSLRELTLTKFHPDLVPVQDEEEASQAPTREELLASAIAVLPHLRSLTFETCGIVSGRFLPLLPNNLISLNITNCGELLSDALQAFLATHGSQIEELMLNHNQSLDLSFLTDLKRDCPKLEVLRMDTTYYSSLSMSSDNEPLYECLLGEQEIPTWPTTLRIIDMEYLRHWNATSATNFFSSLIDSASELPYLRAITIVAMVDTDWRQRAEFRKKWSERFTHVFVRKCAEPSRHLVSLKAFRDWKEKGADSARSDGPVNGTDSRTIEPEGVTSDSDTPLLANSQRSKQGGNEGWGTKRLQRRSRAHASYDEASTDESDMSNDDGDHEEDEEEDALESSNDKDPTDVKDLYVQGLCHTVLFRIDNNRPREETYGEADFLDAEPSDDEDWTGDRDVEDEVVTM